MAKSRSRVADYAVYLLMRTLVCIIQILSWQSALALARALAWLLYQVDRRHRGVAADNLRHAFADPDEAAVAGPQQPPPPPPAVVAGGAGAPPASIDLLNLEPRRLTRSPPRPAPITPEIPAWGRVAVATTPRPASGRRLLVQGLPRQSDAPPQLRRRFLAQPEGGRRLAQLCPASTSSANCLSRRLNFASQTPPSRRTSSSSATTSPEGVVEISGPGSGNQPRGPARLRAGPGPFATWRGGHEGCGLPGEGAES
jgi:hypothetical protein